MPEMDSVQSGGFLLFDSTGGRWRWVPRRRRPPSNSGNARPGFAPVLRESDLAAQRTLLAAQPRLVLPETVQWRARYPPSLKVANRAIPTSSWERMRWPIAIAVMRRASEPAASNSEPVEMRIRVPEIFRRLEGKWQMVQRHADLARH